MHAVLLGPNCKSHSTENLGLTSFILFQGRRAHPMHNLGCSCNALQIESFFFLRPHLSILLQLFFRSLHLPQLEVLTLLLDQFFVRSNLPHTAITQKGNPVAIPYRQEAMCNNERCSGLRFLQRIEGGLDFFFALVVQSGSGFI